ncbi:hypothetical protein DSL64_26325 [Dyadobacter luteus]|uniref:Uncharacterized protein n=1 Tax=Dyadobacter luteus TaxID=2259619 RepID=A0A3D8Y3J6_9BACT|nr:hypothetical protein [Dyadobacter luteus]REA56640.1 hypothetical protein DSL64_26325 [Dyadobacter luteus]
MFKKLNILQKLWLKHSNRAAYKDYKWELANYKQQEFNSFITGTERLTSLDKIQQFVEKHGFLAVCHSGNAGDIIYSLPSLKRIYEITGAPIHFYLRLGKPLILSGYKNHPMGNVKINQKMADMLIPLISSQSYIASCQVHDAEDIHIDLDYFHSGNIPLQSGNIARWCSYVMGVSPQLWKPWIEVNPDLDYTQTIVMGRSERYRNHGISYSFLKQYPEIVFIGIESEYDDIKKIIPHVKWVKVNDFLQMASIIAGAKLFIGNQSFPFSVAEGLKVTRVLETSFQIINVVPEGENGHDFFFQDHLESIISRLVGGKDR